MGVEVEIKFYANLRDIVGQKSVRESYPDDSTIREVLESLGDQYPEFHEYAFDERDNVRPNLIVRRNNETTDMDDSIAANDRISITTQIAGGVDSP